MLLKKRCNLGGEPEQVAENQILGMDHVNVGGRREVARLPVFLMGFLAGGILKIPKECVFLAS